MELSTPDALLLDAGNTLVFLDHQALAEGLEAEGFRLDAAALRAAEPLAKRRYAALLQSGASHEDGWHLLMCVLLAEAGLPRAEVEEAARQARRVHDAFNLWRQVPTDLPAALDRARGAGLRLAVVSNSEGTLDALFARVGLAAYFELVVDSALEGVRKPDAEIFHRALRRLGVEPARALYAGDIPDVDVVGARRAGMQAVQEGQLCLDPVLVVMGGILQMGQPPRQKHLARCVIDSQIETGQAIAIL